jgi:hypothetical protein
MKRCSLVLVGFAGLGSFISSAQSASAQNFSDPFERYLKSIDTNRHEPSLRRFATECGVDVGQVRARYAVAAGDEWQPVSNMRKGLKSLESDFYATVEVWPARNRVLVEMWPNSDDVGSEVRTLYCFARGELQFAEVIEWNLPVVEKPGIQPWGYSRRWERDRKRDLKQVKAVFVDEYEQVIRKPKLDSEEEQSLHWNPALGPLSEQKLPASFFQ